MTSVDELISTEVAKFPSVDENGEPLCERALLVRDALPLTVKTLCDFTAEHPGDESMEWKNSCHIYRNAENTCLFIFYQMSKGDDAHCFRVTVDWVNTKSFWIEKVEPFCECDDPAAPA